MLILAGCGTAEFTIPESDVNPYTNGLEGSEDTSGNQVEDPTRDPDPEEPGDFLVEVSFISPVLSFALSYAYCVDRNLEDCPGWIDAGTVNQEERSSFAFQAQSGNFGFDGVIQNEVETQLVADEEECYLTQETFLWMDGVEVTSLLTYYWYDGNCRAGVSLDDASAAAGN